MMTGLLMFMASFFFIFLKSYQTQVVVGGHYKQAFVISSLLSVVQVLTIILISTEGWVTLPPMALGGSLGVVSAMYLYRRQHKRD